MEPLKIRIPVVLNSYGQWNARGDGWSSPEDNLAEIQAGWMSTPLNTTAFIDAELPMPSRTALPLSIAGTVTINPTELELAMRAFDEALADRDIDAFRAVLGPRAHLAFIKLGWLCRDLPPAAKPAA